MILALFLGILLGAGLTIFTLENASWITVSMLSWQFSAPLAFVLVGVISASVVITLLALLPIVIRGDRYAKKLEGEKKQLENDLSKYQITIPIAPPAPGSRPFVVHQEPEKVYAA